MQQVSESQNHIEVPINENGVTLEHQAVYGQRQPAHAGLTWGYYGGRWGGIEVADGTLTLTNSAANYIVVNRTTAAISVSAATTNWNDANYARVYKVTTAGGVVTAVEDHRAGAGGVHGGSGGGSLATLSDVDVGGSPSPANGSVLVYSAALGKWIDSTAAGVADGDKGDITTSGGGSTWTVDNNAITYAKMQDVSATSRALGRKTAGAGDPEELTLSELLDFIGSAAQGDILYRGAATWARLAAGTAGQVLRTAGAGANPTWGNPLEAIKIAVSDEGTALTTGTAKVTFRMPYAFTVTDVRASLTTAQGSGSIFTVDINESGSTILSTKLTIDNTEKTSTTAATPAVISDSSLADDAEITVDIDQIGNGTAAGLKVYIIGRRT
jgi:hypothetical protein